MCQVTKIENVVSLLARDAVCDGAMADWNCYCLFREGWLKLKHGWWVVPCHIFQHQTVALTNSLSNSCRMVLSKPAAFRHRGKTSSLFSSDWGRPVLHLCDLLGWVCAGLREGQLWPPRPRRLQQPVDPQKVDLWTPPCHQKGVIIQGIRRPHAGLHHRGWGVQLGRRWLWQTGPWEQLNTEVPKTYPGAAAGEGRMSTLSLM